MKFWNRIAKRQRHNLEEFGAEDLWVEIIPMTAYPQRTIEEYTQRDNGIFELCITKWNFTDPETEKELPLPKDDPDVMQDLPTMIVAWIADKIREANDASLPPSLTSVRTTS